MEYTIKYGDDYIKFSDFKWFEDDIEIEFLVEVNSDGFCGISTFGCYCGDFEKVMSEIELIYNFKADKTVLRDMYYDSYLRFESDKTGHLCISGTLYALRRDQKLDFEFMADQTSLRDFLRDWRSFKQPWKNYM